MDPVTMEDKNGDPVDFDRTFEHAKVCKYIFID